MSARALLTNEANSRGAPALHAFLPSPRIHSSAAAASSLQNGGMLTQSLTVIAALVTASLACERPSTTPTASNEATQAAFGAEATPSAGGSSMAGTSSIGGRPSGGTGGVTPIGGSIAGSKADGPR
jgi:hypothetical protein